MTINLRRHKPEPTPTIHPLPERLATGRLAELYEQTKTALGVPWMGVVAMAFAHYPTFYGTLWTALDDIVGTDTFTDACNQLTEAAEREAALLTPPLIGDRLRKLGYDDADVESIRACNDTFHSGNMPYLLMATTARLLLEDGTWPHRTIGVQQRTRRTANPQPTLMEEHHASEDLRAIYTSMKRTLGLPFVNTDYRAFGRWPNYLATAWNDLGPAIRSPSYEPGAARIHEHAVHLATQLPNPTELTSDQLRTAADTDANVDEVLAVVQLFQWLLPGLALNVAYLRHQLN